MLEVIDRQGWRRAYPLEKAIVHIGSAPSNDIVLEPERGAGVSSRHAQLIRMGNAEYRLINLGDTEIILASVDDTPLAPLATVDLRPGTSLIIGDYTLIVGGSGAPDFSGMDASMPAATGYNDSALAAFGSYTSQLIGLRLTLKQTQLAPERPIEGAINVCNQGNRPSVQFDIQLENLDPAYYEVGPAPVLFPNVEKDVFLRIYHPQRSIPPAGEFHFSVRVTAPEAYPGESAVVSQVIHILPFYRHTLSLVLNEP